MKPRENTLLGRGVFEINFCEWRGRIKDHSMGVSENAIRLDHPE